MTEPVLLLIWLAFVVFFYFGLRKYGDWLPSKINPAWHWCNGKGDTPHTFDGCSVHATCSKCGKEVMQDSQGNWF